MARNLEYEALQRIQAKTQNVRIRCTITSQKRQNRIISLFVVLGSLDDEKVWKSTIICCIETAICRFP